MTASGANVTVADDNVFQGRQAFQSHRAARVQLVGTDTDLGTQAVLETVGKTTRGIDHYGT